MTTSPTATSSEQTLYAALELSKNSWLLAIQAPGRDNPSLHPIRGGDTAGLMAKLDAARERLTKNSGQVPKVILCYEAGYDGFWLARFLEQRGIECLVMEPASLQVNRKARRVKTDRIDVEKLLHTLIAWCRGERHVCSMVLIPSVEEEDLRRSHRERERLICERTAHINRIKGLLSTQGIRGINVKRHYKTLKPTDLVTGDGRPLPERLGREIAREIERLALVQEQLREIERERDLAPTPCLATERKRHQLLRLNGIGVVSAAILTREVYYRQFANRRQVASYIGMTPSAYDSGESRRSQGISKAGNRLARRVMIQTAWLWLRHQPESELSKWFHRRTEGQSRRIRCVMIVALARKLAIALWRYLETGLVPQGAALVAK
ncbi:MAG: IS110 family transposase [Xanthomonadales bacterium]|nr:IS110 family transposase [Xanthomonadales bacterium]NIX13145.1 IS110 family transposase [Xanthomonadales bacterium]